MESSQSQFSKVKAVPAGDVRLVKSGTSEDLSFFYMLMIDFVKVLQVAASLIVFELLPIGSIIVYYFLLPFLEKPNPA